MIWISPYSVLIPKNTDKKPLYLAKNTVLSRLLQIGLLYKIFLLYFKATWRNLDQKFSTTAAGEEVVNFYPNNVTKLTRIGNEFYFHHLAWNVHFY